MSNERLKFEQTEKTYLSTINDQNDKIKLENCKVKEQQVELEGLRKEITILKENKLNNNLSTQN